MPSKIDHNLIPACIRESIDPEILKRAQSIEWSINRDIGEDEHGYLDGSAEDYLSSQNLMYKSHQNEAALRKARQIEWLDQQQQSGRDSGMGGETPSSSPTFSTGQKLIEEPLADLAVVSANGPKTTGVMKQHPKGQYPFPIYKVNQEQLKGDVVFEAAAARAPDEQTVHYEKSSRVLNEEELDALGIDPNFVGPNTRATLDEQEEEFIETSVLKGGRRELEEIYDSMRIDREGYFDKRRSKSAELIDERSASRNNITYNSLENVHDDVGSECGVYEKTWMKQNGQSSYDDEPEVDYEKYMAERIKCTILLEPIEPPLQEIKVEPAPIQVQTREPLQCIKGEEEKLIEDPDNIWMHMGPAQYGPPFGTMGKRKARDQEWIGPPCELCHKQIEERRCMLAENMKFHCWHFACSFCLKTLRPADFLIAEADRKPYCLNCHKREFPEIPLANLNLEE